MKRLAGIPFHPILLSAYPIAALFAYNEANSVPQDAVRSLFVSAFMGATVLVLARLVLRNWHKAAIVSSLFLLLFFTYGHVYSLVVDDRLFGLNFGRHRVLVILWLVILAGGTFLAARSRQSLVPWTQTFNAFAGIALLLPVLRIGYLSATTMISAGGRNPAEGLAAEGRIPALRVTSPDQAPDIYYIILDMYTRADILQTRLHFDNGEFVKSLTEMGFYVAQCSRSNYTNTTLSLASSLNLDYLDSVAPELIQASADRTKLDSYITLNVVRLALSRIGYKIVSFDSGYTPTSWQDADTYLSSKRGSPWHAITLGGLNPFESMLMRTSAGLLLYEAEPRLPKWIHPYLDSAYQEYRGRILYAFDTMAEVPSIPGPKFVFVHILAPHNPFVFGPTGEPVVRNAPFALNADLEYIFWNDFAHGYTSELPYINRRVLQVVSGILAKTNRPVVIVIQGDHGIPRPAAEEPNVSILNAYYLPGDAKQRLYPSISPVNTFRLIFDSYLGGDYPLLKDASFVPTMGTKLVFAEAPPQNGTCAPR